MKTKQRPRIDDHVQGLRHQLRMMKADINEDYDTKTLHVRALVILESVVETIAELASPKKPRKKPPPSRGGR